MPSSTTPLVRSITREKKYHFGILYLALILLSLHWSFVVYINSSFIGEYVSTQTTALLYIAASVISIATFVRIRPLLTRVGNYQLTILFAFLEFLVTLSMAYVTEPITATLLFVVHLILVPLLLFNLDIFLESMIGSREQQTGSKRGLYLSILSFAGAVAPLGAGHLVTKNMGAFSDVYIASALILVPFITLIMLHFRDFEDRTYTEMAVMHSIKTLFAHKDLRNVFFAHFNLHVFFTWMTLYTPIFFVVHQGFNWSEVGLIIFAGLMAYVIFEYPIGIVGDAWLGEKEMMAFGFLVIAVSTAAFAFITGATIAVWMFAMFMTRVGASFVEVTTESYFFKHAGGDDADLIGFFRMIRPLSTVFGAIIGSIALLFITFELLYILLGILMIPGLFFAMALKDTK